ncbi:MAG TPA: prolyl oligopeptidase family serine peptidase [Gemmatimonadales bacterium]|jgi:dipeptidyl aminopeptidase/acylaminoacyl peptidase
MRVSLVGVTRSLPLAAALLSLVSVTALHAQGRGRTATPAPAAVPTAMNPAGEADSQSPLNIEGYITPRESIAKLVTAPRENVVTYTTTSPGARKYLIHVLSDGLPTLAQLGRPHYNLGGFQVDIGGNRARAMTTNSKIGFDLFDWAANRHIAVQIPAGARVSTATFAPDGSQLAFIADFPTSTQVYLADPATGKSHPLTTTSLLATNVQNIEWTGDSRAILAVLIPDGRGAEPKEAAIASEPRVRVNEDRKLHTEFFPSLLESPHEKALLEYYTVGQLARIDVKTKAITKIGAPGMIQRLDAAPTGKYFRVTYLDKPFSYILPVSSFGNTQVIVDESGHVLNRLAHRPLREEQDTARDSTAAGRGGIGGGRGGALAVNDTGRRNLAWHPTEPAMIYEQMAPFAPGQRPDTSIKRKDRVLEWAAPFESVNASPKVLYETDGRIGSVAFSDDGHIMFVSQTGTGVPTEVAVYFDEAGKAYPVIAARTGRGGAGGGRAGGGGRGGAGGGAVNTSALMMKAGSHGDQVVLMSTDGKYVYTESGNNAGGRGAAAESNTPATPAKASIDRINVKTGIRERIYETNSELPETIAAPLDDDVDHVLATRESPTVVPQSYVIDTKTHDAKQITDNHDVMPEMAALIHKTIYATRADGHHFKINVTLPADWKPGTRLPALFWFYPAEFASQDAYDRPARGAAGAATANRFPTYAPRSITFMTFAGYAVIEPDTPIFAQNGQLPNDHYVDDIRDDLYATINALDTLGLIDRTRLAIGGHSYGAFSTANAMVHTPYFKAGIAGDGDYNRTLTPTGFQNERRDLWQGKETYLDMSPFLYADHLSGALLMYHSEEDQNVGTAPENSIRMFHALQSLGKTTSLYMYPYEDHGPVARETVLDQWARWTAWLDKYVKNANQPAKPLTP